MPKIKLLDDSLINKIAAGEVIESPASVVKELMENSIDAKAKKIFIEIREGGKSFIRVTDDGCGMDKKDTILSIERHATSKIKEDEDLFNIKTLGFRGEALASIAGICAMQLKTNTGDPEGIELDIFGGKIISQKPRVMPRGTTIIVEELFKNVPVRKKHMKTIETETRKIVELLTSQAIINREIFFELVHNNKKVLSFPPAEKLIDRIAEIFGTTTAKNMLHIDFCEGDMKIKGLISKPGFQKNNKSMQYIYVNKRHIKSAIISEAIIDGYHTFLNIGKQPIYFLNLSINPHNIDVNVHPRKTRIRIEREQNVQGFIKTAIRDVLINIKDEPVRIHTTESDSDFSAFGITKTKQKTLPNASAGTNVQTKDIKTKIESQTNKKHFRVLGQVLKTYIIIETSEGMYIIDQHAAMERVNYEKYLEEYKTKGVSTQKLLEPIIIEVSPTESLLVKHNLESLKNFGFELEEFGKNTFTLRTIPVIFERVQGRDVFLSVLDELKVGASKKLELVKEERIIRKACRISIKAGDILEEAELNNVITDLFNAKQPHTCPHGRPTMIKFTLDDFEKMFRRKNL